MPQMGMASSLSPFRMSWASRMSPCSLSPPKSFALTPLAEKTSASLQPQEGAWVLRRRSRPLNK